jgi:hypothetical protein
VQNPADDVVLFVQIWAEGVLRQLERVRETRQNYSIDLLYN